DRSPSVVHTHLFYADTFGRVAARWAGVPVVVSTEHSTERIARSLRYRIALRATGRLAMRVVAVSESVAAMVLQSGHVPPSRVVVTRNGLEIAPWAGAAPAPRVTLQVESAAFVVGCVGRLDDAKGYDVLVEAVARLADPGVRVVVAGDGPCSAALRAQAAA